MIWIIIAGNTFWLLFANTLVGEKLLTNSLPHIALSFVYPILVFGFYLSTIVFFSILERSKIVWAVVVFFSFLTYTGILGFQWQYFVGEIAISAAVWFFLFSFERSHVLINKKSSIIARTSLALTGTTIVISFVIAVNFFTFYTRTLAQNNLILTNRTIIRGLSPLLRIYLSDLHITNLDEPFGQYLRTEARRSGTTIDQTRKTVLNKLGLSSMDDTKTVRVALVTSLNQSIFKTFSSFRRQIPILISLGLGIITQTMMTLSSIVNYGLLQIYLFLFLKWKLVNVEKREVALQELVTKE